MANNAIAKAREQEIFVVLETTIGTLAPPVVASLVLGAAQVQASQQPGFTDNPEIKNTRDVLSRFTDRIPAGDWSFPLMCRPSGALGTAPEEDVLLECLCGLKTINSSTSVVYTPALTKKSCSIWYKKGHTVFNLRGATVGSGKTSLLTSGGAMWDFGGKFMQKGWAGTDLIAGAATTAATSVVVDDAKKFTVGSLVEFVEESTTYNNTDAGYEVTAVNVGTNTLTISPGLETDLDDDSTIQGWLPTGTIGGGTIANRLSSATVDTVATDITAFDITINDQPRYFDEEITSSDYPETFGEVAREVTGNISMLFREDDLKYYYDGIQNTDKALRLIHGTTSGSIMQLNLAKTNLNVPSEEENDPTIALSSEFKAYATTGEDSFSITFI